MDVPGIGMTSQRTRDRLIKRLEDQGIGSLRVLEAMANVPRHLFIEEALAHRAYEDTALPIGHGQTISQPFVVALMTQALLDKPLLAKKEARILEIGTGSGYQTAVLAKLVRRVYSIERIQALLTRAQERLYALGHRNTRFRHSDGIGGWPEDAPFDGILVAAAPRRIPEALIEQLAIGGRLVIPVGNGEVQDLRIIDRTEEGFEESTIEAVRFVPLVAGVSKE
jgi:protein-L-isoaspartate(D-aspartate) O-methyltransferase